MSENDGSSFIEDTSERLSNIVSHESQKRISQPNVGRIEGKERQEITPSQQHSSLCPNQRPECFKTTFQEIVCIMVLTSAVGQASLSAGVCQVITSTIGHSLHMSQGQITWINTASALMAGSFLLFFGNTADTFGRKRQLLTSFVVFLIGCLCSGFATNTIFFATFRGLQGLASAAAIPAAVGILGNIYDRPSPRKNKAFACFSAGNPLGFVTGSITSGVATNILSWRASFFLLAIIYAVVIVLAWFVVPNDAQPMKVSAWKNLDIVGAALTSVGFVLICAALTMAGNTSQGWQTPWIPTVLVIGIVVVFIFIWWESQCKNPLMPLHIWRNRTFSMLMVMASFGYICFVCNQFWISLYFQEVRKLSALRTAVWLIPQAASGIIVNILAAIALSAIDNRLLLVFGSITYVGTSTLYATQSPNGIYWFHPFCGLIISVIGVDLFYNITNMYVLSSLPKTHQSTAGGIFNTMLQLAQATGLGLSTAIYNTVVTEDRTEHEPWLNGFRAVFWFTCSVAAFTVIFVPFLKLRRQGELNKEKQSEKIVDEEGKAQEPLTIKAVWGEDTAEASTEYGDEKVNTYPVTPPEAHIVKKDPVTANEAC